MYREDLSWHYPSYTTLGTPTLHQCYMAPSRTWHGVLEVCYGL